MKANDKVVYLNKDTLFKGVIKTINDQQAVIQTNSLFKSNKTINIQDVALEDERICVVCVEDLWKKTKRYLIERKRHADLMCEAKLWPQQQYIMEYVHAPREFEYDDVVVLIDGREHIYEEKAAAVLLQDGILFVNDGTDPESIYLFVECNDVFAWGHADAEHLYTEDLLELYKLHMLNPNWGSVQWVSFKRNMQPQDSIIAAMKENGSWNDRLEALPKNPLSTS
jgi:hypothetical protein